MKKLLIAVLFLALMPVAASAADIGMVIWDASPEPEVVGYLVEYSIDSGATWKLLNVTDKTYIVMPNAPNGTIARVKAVTDIGYESVWSPPCDARVITIPAPVNKPWWKRWLGL